MDSLEVVVGTFGDREWIDLAHSRAIPSAEAQGVRVTHRHGETVAQARNEGLALARSEFVVHLDADDELEPGFVDAILAAEGDVRVPRVSCYRDEEPIRGGVFMPRVWRHRHECKPDCLQFGSWIVVGAAVRVELARRIGGWREYEVYEDFDLWQRCWLAGADIQRVPEAIYRQHLRAGSRNHSLSKARMNAVHGEIERANGVSRAKGWRKPVPA